MKFSKTTQLQTLIRNQVLNENWNQILRNVDEGVINFVWANDVWNDIEVEIHNRILVNICNSVNK